MVDRSSIESEAKKEKIEQIEQIQLKRDKSAKLFAAGVRYLFIYLFIEEIIPTDLFNMVIHP